MWTTIKNNLLGKKNLSCSFYLYRFRKYVSYGFPTIKFCNTGVHYETPFITVVTLHTVCQSDMFRRNTGSKSWTSFMIFLIYVGQKKECVTLREIPRVWQRKSVWRSHNCFLQESSLYWSSVDTRNKIILESYVYWTVHHLDSWIKRDQLDVTCFIISLFNVQHVSDVNTSILRRLRLTCYFMGCIAQVRCMYSGFSLHTDTTPPQPNHNITPTHIEPEQYNPWNNSTNKSQDPEDGCINIRNMLSIK